MNDDDKYILGAVCFVASSVLFFMSGYKLGQDHPHSHVATVTHYVDTPYPVPDPRMGFGISKLGFGEVELTDAKGKVYQTMGGYVKGHPCELGEGVISYCKLGGLEVIIK